MASDNSVKLAAIIFGSQLLVVLTFVLFALGAITGEAIQYGVFIILSIVALLLLSSRGGGILIAGYNTMPESEKAKYDQKALSRAVGVMLLGINFSTLLFVVAMQRGGGGVAVRHRHHHLHRCHHRHPDLD